MATPVRVVPIKRMKDLDLPRGYRGIHISENLQVVDLCKELKLQLPVPKYVKNNPDRTKFETDEVLITVRFDLEYGPIWATKTTGEEPPKIDKRWAANRYDNFRDLYSTSPKTRHQFIHVWVGKKPRAYRTGWTWERNTVRIDDVRTDVAAKDRTVTLKLSRYSRHNHHPIFMVADSEKYRGQHKITVVTYYEKW